MSSPVSVVITCFNLERYIGEAIQSVLAQECSASVEVIIVDDCSTDESATIIRSFAGIRYIRTARNGGVLQATLAGLKACSGDLIFFLDGDDVWEPTKLSMCIAEFDADPQCALVTHDVAFMDGAGRSLVRDSRPAQVLGKLSQAGCGPAVIGGILSHGDFVWLGSALAIRKSLARLDEFADWAMSLPDPANTYQDWPLAYWIASLPDITAVYVPQKLFRYRLHGANYSGDASNAVRASRNFARSRNTLQAMYRIAADRGLPVKMLRRLKHREQANDYLASLYRGARGHALASFPGVAGEFLKEGRLSKELVRLAGVLLVGPDRFAGWASRRTLGRAQER